MSVTPEPEAVQVRLTHMRLLSAVTLLGLCAVSGCGGDGSKVFGEQSEPCPATVLTNDAEDDQKTDDGTDCLMTEVEAGRPVVWDVLVPTVEGDPIPTRYAFDANVVRITTDSSRDTFGSGGVVEQRCDGLRRTSRLPEGVDCTTSSGDGFKSSSLPGGA